MSDVFEDFKKYLPRYLSSLSSKELFDGLKDFPENMNKRFYTDEISLDEDIIYQGDGIRDLPFIVFPSTKTGNLKAVILTNTCDNDINNKRLNTSYICYSPLILLDSYKESLLKNSQQSKESVRGHIDSIKRQEATQFFYFPRGGNLENDSIIDFSLICSCTNKSIARESLRQKRLFSLSNYGFYLLLFKMSIHFCRMGENIDRR